MTTDVSSTALSYAARPAVVAKYLGQLLLALGALGVVPLAVALWDCEFGVAWRLAAAAGGLAALGGAAARIETQARIQANEALAVSALSYVLAAGAMAFPLMAHGLDGIDALFESASALTTTGLSTLVHVERMPRSLLFLRAWMQWYGGLGIVILSVALLVGDDAIAHRLIGTDSPESLVTTMRLHARRMAVTYLALTVFGVALIMACGADAFSAICHALAAVSTGGFSIYDDSLAGFAHPSARVAVIAVCLAGAVSLPLGRRLAKGDWRAFARDAEVRALAVALLVVTALVYAFEAARAGTGSASLLDAVLMSASAQSTAGFATLPTGTLGAGAKLVLMVAMATGGCIGSTAGGVKLLRVVLLGRLVSSALRRTSLATGAVDTLRLGGERLESDAIVRNLVLFILFVLTVVFSWIPFVIAGYAPVDALFEVVSATATVGLSVGITSHALAPGLKAILCLDMMLGRLEFIALLVLVYPSTWFGKKRSVT